MYLVSVMGLSALSILCTLIVLSVHHSDSPRRPPAWMRRLVFNCLSKLLLMRRKTIRDHDSYHYDKHHSPDNDEHHCRTMSNGVATTKSSQSLFGSLRLGEGKQKHEPAEDFQKQLKAAEQWQLLETTARDVNTGVLFGIKHELSRLTDKLTTDKASSRVKAEWVFMAKVLDRLFFSLFLLATVLVAVVILNILVT